MDQSIGVVLIVRCPLSLGSVVAVELLNCASVVRPDTIGLVFDFLRDVPEVEELR